jgi:hypothetical protein
MCAQPLSHGTHQTSSHSVRIFPHTIRLIQHNTAKSTNVMQTLLHLAHKTTDIILVQEPWVRFDKNSNTWNTLSHPSYTSILPPSPAHIRPRVATFLSKTAAHISLTPRNDLANDPDAQCLTLSTPSTPPILLINLYNEKSQSPDNDERTIERCIHQIPLPDRAIIVGDFNAHHQWWNSSVKTPKRAETIINWTDTHRLQLINEEDIPTYHYRNGTGTSILDLTFVRNPQTIDTWTTPTSRATTTLSKPVFEIYSTTPPPIDLKFSPHHRQHLPPSLSNFQARRSSFAIFIAIVVVVVVLLPPCHTPVRGKTTPKNRNPHHFKQHHAHPDTKNIPNRLENFSLGISGPEKTNPQLSANSVVRLLSYNRPGTKNPQISGFQVTPFTLPLSLTYPPPTVPLRPLPP